MPSIMRAIIPFLICSLGTLSAEPGKRPADSLSQEQLQEAFSVLRREYVNPDELSFLEINRAALTGILEKLDLGAELVAVANGEDSQSGPAPTATELLDDQFGYFRPTDFRDEELAKLDETLEDYSRREMKTLILDLRQPGQSGSFTQAARFLDRFCEPNTVVFKIVKPGEDRPRSFITKSAERWEKEILLLVDEDTSPAAEVVGHVLLKFLPKQCFVIGTKTRGAAVEYSTVALSEKIKLQMAASFVQLPDGTSLFRKGIEPNLEAVMFSAVKRDVFEKSAGKSIAPFISDKERPFLSEAALVAGTNPELPLRVAKSKGEDPFNTVPMQDRVLQTAVDFLKARAVVEKD